MKRFLSIFAILAMVVSMFSGVAFAATAANTTVEITSDDESVVYLQKGESGATEKVIVKVAYTGDASDINSENLVIVDKNVTNPSAPIAITDIANTIEVTVPTDVVGKYYISMEGVALHSDNETHFVDTGSDGYVETDDTTVKSLTVFVGKAKVVLDNNDDITSSSKFGTHKLTGKIMDAGSGASLRVTTKVFFYRDGFKTTSDKPDGIFNATKDKLEETVIAKDGVFEMTVKTMTPGQYFVVADDTSTDLYFDNTEKASYDAVKILNGVELASPEELEYTYPISGQVVIQGVFVNEDYVVAESNPEESIVIGYLLDNDQLDDSTKEICSYVDKSSFGFLLDGSTFNKVGKIGIFVDGTLAIKGKIKAGDLDVSMSNAKIVRQLGPQKTVLDFKLADKYVDGDGMKKVDESSPTDYEYKLRYTLLDDNGKVYNSLEEQVMVDGSGNNFKDVAKQKYELTLNCNNYPTGDYKLVVELFNDIVGGATKDTVVLAKELDFEIVNPSTYTVIGWDLKEPNVGDIVIQFPDDHQNDLHTDDPSTMYHGDEPKFASYGETPSEQLWVTKYTSAKTYPKYFEITANGAGIDNKTYANFGEDKVDLDSSGAMFATFKATETGTLTFTVKAYFSSNVADGVEEKAAYTFTKEVEVKGWNVEVTPNKVTVGSEEDVTFTITDEDGNPVNNAIIKIDGVVVVNGTTSNIVGGVYVYEDDEKERFVNVDKYDVTLHKELPNQPAFVTLAEGMEVVGEEVFTVTSDKDTLINGIEESVYVTVLNADGNVEYPEFTRIDIDAKGKESAGTLKTGSRKDLDGDGVKEAVKITVTPAAGKVAMIIRATTDNAKKMGEVRINVEKPQVVMANGRNNFTNNFENDFEFQVIDPRDNSVLDYDVDFQVVGDIAYVDDFNYIEGKNLQSIDDVWKGTYLIGDVDYKKAAKDDKEVNVDLIMSGDNSVDVTLLEIPVVKPSLTSTPDRIIIGTGTTLTLTYVDADGKAIPEREVTLSGEVVGETDENGQVVYATSSTNSLSLSFKAATDFVDDKDDANADNDEDVFTLLKVKSAADVEAPVVTYELNGNTAIITITDNVRIYKAVVNGEVVDMFFPMPTATHIVTGLKAGDNKVTVLAADTNNNYTQQDLVITVEATAEPVSFKLNEETEFGTPAKVDGVTMVPVRFAEKLGATVDWNDETETVTYTTGEKTIAMTIGSKTAVVNGENVQLKNAPYKNELGRTMVPVRMIATELGFTVNYVSDDAPITIE